MSRPTLSICIPNYNMGRWVAGAIDSALAQEPQDLVEIVVVDNASTDDSREVLERYRGIPRLRIELADEHLPMADNWNRAVRASSGEWCVLLSADDELVPAFTRNLMPWLGDKRNTLVSQIADVMEGNPPTPASHVGDDEFTIYEGPDGLLRAIRWNHFPLCTTAFRRNAFDQARGFHGQAGLVADWDLWIRVLTMDGSRAIATGCRGGRYHVERGSTWRVRKLAGRDLHIMARCLAHHQPVLREFGLHMTVARHVGEQAVRCAMTRAADRNLSAAARYLLTAIRYGSARWRVSALAESLLLLSGASPALSRWRIVSHPAARSREFLMSLWGRRGIE